MTTQDVSLLKVDRTRCSDPALKNYVSALRELQNRLTATAEDVAALVSVGGIREDAAMSLLPNGAYEFKQGNNLAFSRALVRAGSAALEHYGLSGGGKRPRPAFPEWSDFSFDMSKCSEIGIGLDEKIKPQQVVALADAWRRTSRWGDDLAALGFPPAGERAERDLLDITYWLVVGMLRPAIKAEQAFSRSGLCGQPDYSLPREQRAEIAKPVTTDDILRNAPQVVIEI